MGRRLHPIFSVTQAVNDHRSPIFAPRGSSVFFSFRYRTYPNTACPSSPIVRFRSGSRIGVHLAPRRFLFYLQPLVRLVITMPEFAHRSGVEVDVVAFRCQPIAGHKGSEGDRFEQTAMRGVDQPL